MQHSLPPSPGGASRRRTPRDTSPTGQPGTADTAGCALVLHGDGLTLLHDLDPYGCYGRAEPLDPATVGARLPELATAIERHRQEYAADLAATRQCVRLAEDDEEDVPF